MYRMQSNGNFLPNLSIRKKSVILSTKWRWLQVAEDLLGRVFAAGAEHAAAGVARRAAKIQALNRRAMVGPAGDGAEAEQLVGAHRSLHDVAAGDAERAFEV